MQSHWFKQRTQTLALEVAYVWYFNPITTEENKHICFLWCSPKWKRFLSGMRNKSRSILTRFLLACSVRARGHMLRTQQIFRRILRNLRCRVKNQCHALISRNTLEERQKTNLYSVDTLIPTHGDVTIPTSWRRQPTTYHIAATSIQLIVFSLKIQFMSQLYGMCSPFI